MLQTSILKEKEQFVQLQSQLSQRWNNLESFYGSNLDLIVVPSMSLEEQLAQNINWLNHYEERLLFSLIHLRNPEARLIYLTSQPLHPTLIDYYLHLIIGLPISQLQNRLILLSTYDASTKPLSQKILERPRLIKRLRQTVKSRQACIICFNSTPLERTLSVQLDVPLFALNPDLDNWGGKMGSRQIFTECGVPHPQGSHLIKKDKDLAIAVNELWENQPSLRRILIKLDQGFSGFGNALLDLNQIKKVVPGYASSGNRIEAIYQQFPYLRFQSETETWSNFSNEIKKQGAIVETFVEGNLKNSPSVQGCIMPNGEVEILSTHEQFLGGLDGMTYLGCRFPADEAYRLQLQELGKRVGQNLATKGALDCFSVDFLAVEYPSKNGVSKWDIQAIEINLRKGGTTHPFMLLKFLTNGKYNHSDGLFYSQQGNSKYYIASDNLKEPRYRGLLTEDLMDIITKHELHFDKKTQTGVVFHLTNTLSEFGKMGLTCIGNSIHEAEGIYNNVVKVFDEETRINC